MTTAQRMFYTADTTNAEPQQTAPLGTVTVREHSYFRYTRIAHAARDRGLGLDSEQRKNAASVWFAITAAACRMAARGEWVRV